MARIIAVASGKGGVGKTFIVSNLGAAIAKQGKNVVMVDADIDMANLELALGQEGRPITLQHVLKGEARIEDALYSTTNGAKFVPAGISPAQFRRVDPEKLARLISKLEDFGDYVLLDCPAGVGKDTIACFAASPETLLVLTPEPMAASDAYKTKIVAEKMGSRVLGYVTNRVSRVRGELREKELSVLLSCQNLAEIPEDAHVRGSVIDGKPLVGSNSASPAAVEVQKLAARLTGASYIPEARNKSLLSWLMFWKST